MTGQQPLTAVVLDWLGWNAAGGEKAVEESLGLTKPVVTISTAMVSLMSLYCIESGSCSLMGFSLLTSVCMCVCVCVSVCVCVCVCLCVVCVSVCVCV